MIFWWEDYQEIGGKVFGSEGKRWHRGVILTTGEGMKAAGSLIRLVKNASKRAGGHFGEG